MRQVDGENLDLDSGVDGAGGDVELAHSVGAVHPRVSWTSEAAGVRVLAGRVLVQPVTICSKHVTQLVC